MRGSAPTIQSADTGVNAGQLPVAVAIDAEGDIELATDILDDVRGEEIGSQARNAFALGLNPGDGAHSVTVVVLVPAEEEWFTPVNPRLATSQGRQQGCG